VRSILDAIQEGFRYYDFLRGDERFKLHLTKSARKTVTLVIGRSPSAGAYLQALQVKDFVKEHFPGWWNRLTGVPNPAPRQSSPEEGKAELEGESGVAG
jgi:CelD/BcsL family acetyltransferase involved in cellulose biosynthesis